MLNEYLSEEELQTELKEFLDAYNLMFTQLDPEREGSIFQDKKLLAILHHSVNISRYSQKAFRQKLFVGAPNEQIVSFAKSIDMPYSTFEETQTVKFRDTLASFTWGNNDQTKDFVRIFGYPEYLVPSSNKDKVSGEIIEPHDEPFKQLKDYQATMVFEALDQVKNPNAKFLIHMPTGAGKTRVAMEIISHFLNEKEGRQVIWLADKVELCEQAMDTFLNVWKHLGSRRLQTYRIWAGAEIPRQIDNYGFIVAMYQTIRNPIKNNQLTIKADLIVPDEAHTAIAKTYAEIIDSLKDIFKKQTRVMGLTATPGRGSSDISENADLVNFFNNNIIGIDTEDGTIEYLQKKRILSKCVRRALNTDITYQLSKQEWNMLAQSFAHEFPDGLLEKIANDEKRNVKIVLRLKELAKECKHILVFCGSIKQSKLLSGFMTASGYNSAYVDGESPRNYRKDVVSKFRGGQLQFVFNYNLFAAGFDAPKIDAVVIARPTTSVVLYGQMIGRGMRGSAIGGTDEFQLVDVVDDIITEYGGLDDVHEYFSEYWD